MKRHEVQEFVRIHRRRSSSFLDRKLWDIAESAPLGGHVVSPGVDPYLLRIYISPRDPQFRWLWRHVRRCVDIGVYDPQHFRMIPHLYLHHFFRGDGDEEVHDHPWGFSVSLILTDGYVEERWMPTTKTLKTRRLYPGDINVIRKNDFHRVTLMSPERGCWTLFMTSDRVEEKSGYDWGFLDPKTEQYTPWGPWVQRREEALADAQSRGRLVGVWHERGDRSDEHE